MTESELEQPRKDLLILCDECRMCTFPIPCHFQCGRKPSETIDNQRN